VTLEGIFDNGGNGGRAALIGYLPAGFPDPEGFPSILSSLAAAGMQCIEIGIPTKHPFLDGRVISSALNRAHEQGLTFARAASISGDALRSSDLAGIGMIYHTTLMEVGIEEALSSLKRNHFQAVLVPDLPPGRWSSFALRATSHELKPIGFLSARMPDEQIEETAVSAEGFLYLQAYEGSTGNRIRIDHEIAGRLKRVKEIAARRCLPVAVGFGIHSAEEARKLQEVGADGIIIGTALVEAAAQGRERAQQFIAEILRALSGKGLTHEADHHR